MSLLNLPTQPTLNQVASSGGVFYKWNGSKWKRVDVISTPDVTEYSEVALHSSNTVVIDTQKYNYNKIEIAANTIINIANVAMYSSTVVEIGQTFDVSKTHSISDATYDGNITTSDSTPRGMAFSVDGTKFYYAGDANNQVFQLNLATPWVLSSVTSTNNSTVVSTYAITPYRLAFKSDGTRMYLLATDQGKIQTYTLSTPWAVSSLSLLEAFPLSGTTGATDFAFKPDGSKVYLIVSGVLYSYVLSTPWALSTAVYDTTSTTLTGQGSTPQAIVFHPDGSKVYTLGGDADIIHQYNLPAPWSLVGGVTYSGNFLSVEAQTPTPQGILFNNTGTEMYISAPSKILQYSTYSDYSTTVTWPSEIKWQSGSAPATNTGETTLVNLINYGDQNIIGSILSRSMGGV